MEITFLPIIEAAIGLLAVALLTIGTWAIKKLGDKLNFEGSEQLEAALMGFLIEAIEYGEQKLYEQGKRYNIQTENELVANAVNFVIKQAPQILAILGIDEEGIEQRIRAYLNRKEYEGEE